ncbi:MAG: hypothetical protein JW714_00975 [Candidatus Omnitrophica bacterium]|nr:hypothetical protein [Candidatus Omnitrophota bacterium]
MNYQKPKSIQTVEEKLAGSDPASIRHQVLKGVKLFKTSWIELGQALYTVWKDKLYKDWGFAKFESYTAKEIGIRKQTALKLLRSYCFLEKEEPTYLKKDYNEGADAAAVPTYESIDALRLASNKKDLDRMDLEQLKKNVLQKGKDAREVKKELTVLMKQRQELLPEEAWQKKRLALLKRSLSLLKTLREEIKIAKMFSAEITKDIDKLVSKLETEMP